MNPASRVDAPRVEMKEMRTWTAVDVRRFLAGVADDRLFALWLLLCTTGMRRGEALGLGWRDIDFAGGNVAVRRQLVEVNYELRYSEPKTARGRRSVALDPYTVVALREHRYRQRKERTDLGALAAAELVFTKLDGTPLQPQNVSQAEAANVLARAVFEPRLDDAAP